MLATVAKDIFPATLSNTSSPVVVLDQTAPFLFMLSYCGISLFVFLFAYNQPAADHEAFVNNDIINLHIWQSKKFGV